MTRFLLGWWSWPRHERTRAGRTARRRRATGRLKGRGGHVRVRARRRVYQATDGGEARSSPVPGARSGRTAGGEQGSSGDASFHGHDYDGFVTIRIAWGVLICMRTKARSQAAMPAEADGCLIPASWGGAHEVRVCCTKFGSHPYSPVRHRIASATAQITEKTAWNPRLRLCPCLHLGVLGFAPDAPWASQLRFEFGASPFFSVSTSRSYARTSRASRSCARTS